jgi:hypothetical protein
MHTVLCEEQCHATTHTATPNHGNLTMLAWLHVRYDLAYRFKFGHGFKVLLLPVRAVLSE